MTALSKTSLRKDMRQKMHALAAAGAPHFSADIVDALKAYRCISLYIPLSYELDPTHLARALRTQGTQLALPRIALKNQPLVFHVWQLDDVLQPDALGIMAPLPSAAVTKPDLVIAPLLAFDTTGNRLGQGGGYYDRTMKSLKNGGSAFAGLGWSEQKIPQTPAEAHDVPLDFIITPAGILHPRMLQKPL